MRPGRPADKVRLTSSGLEVEIDAARGGQIVHVGRPGGANILFHATWTSPLPAGTSTSYGSDGLDWLSHYRGGWQVMFPNAGASSTVDDVPLPLHGEVSTARQTIRDVEPTSVLLESGTRRPIRLERRISIDPQEPVLRVVETAINDDDVPLPVAWGQHPAFVAPEGCFIDLPPGPVHVDADFDDVSADLEPGSSSAWPQARTRAGRVVDLSRVPPGPAERVCYLPDRPAAWAALRDPSSGHGVAMAWDGSAWPHLWLWQQLGGRRFPCFGRARIIALEPVNTWPADGLAAALERGQGAWLSPGQEATTWITLRLFEADDAPVASVDRHGGIGFDASSTVSSG